MKLIKEFLTIMELDAAPAAAGTAPAAAPAPDAAKAAPTTPPTPEAPKEIAKAGDFKVVLGQNEQISILDSKGAVRLSMPMVVWKDLCRQQ